MDQDMVNSKSEPQDKKRRCSCVSANRKTPFLGQLKGRLGWDIKNKMEKLALLGGQKVGYG